MSEIRKIFIKEFGDFTCPICGFDVIRTTFRDPDPKALQICCYCDIFFINRDEREKEYISELKGKGWVVFRSVIMLERIKLFDKFVENIEKEGGEK